MQTFANCIALVGIDFKLQSIKEIFFSNKLDLLFLIYTDNCMLDLMSLGL